MIGRQRPLKDYGLELWGVKKLNSADCNLQSSSDILHTVTLKVQLYHVVFIIVTTYLMACGQKIKYPIKAKGDWLKINDCKLHVGNRMWTNVFFMLILRKHQTTPDLAQRAFCLRTQKWMLFYFCRGQTVPACYQHQNRRENNIKWCHSSLYSLPRNTMICLLCLSKSGTWKGYSICIKLDFIMDCGFLVLWHHLVGDNRNR